MKLLLFCRFPGDPRILQLQHFYLGTNSRLIRVGVLVGMVAVATGGERAARASSAAGSRSTVRARLPPLMRLAWQGRLSPGTGAAPRCALRTGWALAGPAGAARGAAWAGCAS